jgi:peptidoglycan-associated lipoprotein
MNKILRVSVVMLLVLALAALTGCGTEQPAPKEPAKADAQETSSPAVAQARAVSLLKKTPIYFAFDRYDLDSVARADLQVKADLLKKYPGVKVQIEGHCDSRGTEEYNLALGERRARAAYDYLLMLGVRPSQLTTHSYGKMYPAVQGNSEEAWSKNRRDEFNVTTD